jgi:SAM-dependent methyltransferase
MNPVFAEQYGAFEAWHWWFRGRVRILSAVLRRELGVALPARIASVGCGPLPGIGWLVPFLTPGGRVIGVDADVRHARDAPAGCLAAAGVAEAIPLRSASCDLVVALDVIEHLDDDAAGLRECARVLRPGGLLVVTVPALPSLWGAQDVVSRHRRRYTRATLSEAFERAGLSPAGVTYFNSLLLPTIAAVRWARRLWPPRGPVRSDFEDTRPGIANRLLSAAFGAEAHLVGRVSLPIGVSLLATARRAAREPRSTGAAARAVASPR